MIALFTDGCVDILNTHTNVAHDQSQISWYWNWNFLFCTHEFIFYTNWKLSITRSIALTSMQELWNDGRKFFSSGVSLMNVEIFKIFGNIVILKCFPMEPTSPNKIDELTYLEFEWWNRKWINRDVKYFSEEKCKHWFRWNECVKNDAPKLNFEFDGISDKTKNATKFHLKPCIVFCVRF